MLGPGCGAGGGLSQGSSSAMLGAQDAEHPGAGAEARLPGGQAGGGQAIYGAANKNKAQAAFGRFQWEWQYHYPAMVRQLEKDLLELLSFFSFPRPLWRKLRTTNVIERCFVEVRRRTRPMVCFVNVNSVDRIVFSIFNRFNEQWRNRTLRLFTQAA
jgi:putative transposase